MGLRVAQDKYKTRQGPHIDSIYKSLDNALYDIHT